MIKYLLTWGIGGSPGSVQYLTTLGFSIGAAAEPPQAFEFSGYIVFRRITPP
jgi:hypothetical protein